MNEIRDMKLSDLDRVIEIENQTKVEPWVIHIFADCIKFDYYNKVILHNNHIVGFAVARHEPDAARLLNLCIDVRHADKGTGNQLLNAMILQLLDENPQIEHMYAEVNINNVQSIALCKANGFNHEGTYPDYYKSISGNREDALRMVKHFE